MVRLLALPSGKRRREKAQRVLPRGAIRVGVCLTSSRLPLSARRPSCPRLVLTLACGIGTRDWPPIHDIERSRLLTLASQCGTPRTAARSLRNTLHNQKRRTSVTDRLLDSGGHLRHGMSVHATQEERRECGDRQGSHSS